jgi:hypothetical protein
MGEPRELVGRIVLQQEGQSDMGSEVNPLDGLDAEPCNAGRCVLDARLSDWPTGVDDRSDESGNGKIEDGIEPAQAGYARKLAPLLRDVRSADK